MRLNFVLLSSLFLAATTATALTGPEIETNLAKIRLPPGFAISLYAADVPNARQMALGDNGTLFVGSRTAGNVYALVDENGDHRIDKRYTLMTKDQRLSDGTKLVMPTGIAFRDGALYVGAVSHILRFDNIEAKLANPGDPTIVTNDLPDKKHHGWKYIAFGPDGKLYLSVGAWCNICDNEDEYFASIVRMNADGSDLEVIAKGVRNTVGFDWHPQTGDLWFTENGADNLGDDMPAEELNRLSEKGQHFGYPYVHQGDTLDKKYGDGYSPTDFTPPEMRLAPHVAALGMLFNTGSMFPGEYKNQIFIAEHGSWNRSTKIGYRVTLVRLDENNEAIGYEDFASGWLEGKTAWGRPADIFQLPDGSLLISDDSANAIYRIRYDGN